MTATSTSAPSANQHAGAIAGLDAYVGQVLPDGGAPGIAVAISTPGGETIVCNYGYADAAAKSLVTDETLFEFGSIGKSFTAIVFMQLVAEGRMDLQASVAQYLPWFHVGSHHPPFTIHHLLTHTSGLIGGNDQVPDGSLEVWHLRRTSTFAAPGEHFAYSNVGYKTLGLILESVEGKPYAEIVAERILKPLGMEHTHASITSHIRPKLAVGYAPRYDDRLWIPEHGIVPATWLETNTGDGCIASTAADLSRYARMLLDVARGNDCPVLTSDQLNTMRIPHAGESPEPDYGYALQAYRIPECDDELFGHSGGMVGYLSQLTIDVTHGITIVCFANGNADTTQLANRARDLFAAVIDGTPIPDLEQRKSEAIGDDLLGEWIAPDGSAATLTATKAGATLTWNGNVLELVIPSGHRRGGDTLAFRDADWSHYPLEFEREMPESEDSESKADSNAVAPGAIAMHYGGTTFCRPDASPLPTPDYPAEWSTYVGHYRSYNPWNSNFRIVLRNGKLMLVSAYGSSTELKPDGKGFRYGHRGVPDSSYIEFDAIVNGHALVARSDVGEEFARFFVP